jgi:hypothetical protein
MMRAGETSDESFTCLNVKDYSGLPARVSVPFPVLRKAPKRTCQQPSLFKQETVDVPGITILWVTDAARDCASSPKNRMLLVEAEAAA